MAISKDRKAELVEQYGNWLTESQAVFLTEYTGLSVPELDDLRKKIREVGGEYHIVKNTLGKIAFETAELPLGEGFFIGTTAISFVADDPPGLAKVLSDFAKESDSITIKGGYLGNDLISSDQIKFLANLPPLPVLRAQLLGMLMSPATNLARLMSEPARQLAQILKAYAERDAIAESG